VVHAYLQSVVLLSSRCLQTLIYTLYYTTATTVTAAKQLASRPALEALQQQGIVLPESLSSDHAAAAAKLEASLAHRDQTDALWRAKPDQLGGGHRCASPLTTPTV
jgi:hypothetical protein